MNTSIPIIIVVYGIISLFALFIYLKKLVPAEHKKLTWVRFLSGVWAFIFIVFIIMDFHYKYFKKRFAYHSNAGDLFGSWILLIPF